MKIRRFKLEDAQRVSEIIWAALETNNSKDYGEAVLLTMKQVYTSENICILSKSRVFIVAEEGKNIIGVGGIEGNLISSVFVDPKAQGIVLGKCIMEALESIAKEENHEFVLLHSSLTAESFYAKIAYSVERRIDDPVYGENILMKKLLSVKP
jgi:GNAT superfamily N-acetyltransferase